MKGYVDLGGTPEFKLAAAVLVYQGGKTAFATLHPVTHRDRGTPGLDPAQPLSTAFLRALAGELGYRLPVEILPENVLVRTPEMLAWWCRRTPRTMFFASHAKELAPVSGRLFPQPALVFKVIGQELWVRALPKDARPNANTTLMTAPYWNCSEEGRVCQGTMRAPEEGTSLKAMETWERAFFRSEFTHAYGAARLTTHPGGFAGLWSSLANSRKAFPAPYLTDARETLQQFVERRG
jgi:PRTRC genetic system protein B